MAPSISGLCAAIVTVTPRKRTIPTRLYRQLKNAARLAECGTEDVILSAIEVTLPPLLKNLAPESAKELTPMMMMLDSEALRAIAAALLPPKRRRRFTTLLRKEQARRLSAREKEELDALKGVYLRLSQNKTRRDSSLGNEMKQQDAKGEFG